MALELVTPVLSVEIKVSLPAIDFHKKRRGDVGDVVVLLQLGCILLEKTSSESDLRASAKLQRQTVDQTFVLTQIVIRALGILHSCDSILSTRDL